MRTVLLFTLVLALTSLTGLAAGPADLIDAVHYDEAVQRSMDHPHLEYGGTLEVRQLYAM